MNDGVRTEKVADDERLDDAAVRHFGPGARVALSDYSYPTDCPLVGFLEAPDGTLKVVDVRRVRRRSKAEETCAEFNSRVPVGTAVVFWPTAREGHGRPSRTRSEAWVLGGHTAVVMVEGHTGGVALSHVAVDPRPR